MSSSAEEVTRREATSFPEKLFQILEHASDDSSLWWVNSGSSFCILPKQFDHKEAVEYFQGTQFSGITRRLFRYGFDRVATRKGCTEYPSGALIFENQFFRKGRFDLLKLIKIDNKRLYRKAIHRDDVAGTTSCTCRDAASIPTVMKAPPTPIVSSIDNYVKLDLLLRVEQVRRENERQNFQIALEQRCLQKALLLGRMRAMHEATAMPRSLNHVPDRNSQINMVLSTQASNKSLANELLLRSVLPGTRHYFDL